MTQQAIEMTDTAFTPIQIEIDPGSTVIWENTSEVTHAVRSV